jgi:hypothetical protein
MPGVSVVFSVNRMAVCFSELPEERVDPVAVEGKMAAWGLVPLTAKNPKLSAEVL